VDWLNTGVTNAQRARSDAIDALNRLGPTNKIALYSLDRDGLHIVSEIGSSTAGLVESIGRLSGTASPCRATSLLEASETVCDDPLIPAQQVEFFMKARIEDTLKALRSIAAHLRGLPGRKSLVWISSGVPAFVFDAPIGARTFPNAQSVAEKFPEDFASAFRELNNAGVAVYPVDARGLPVVAISDDPRFPGSAMYQFTTPIMDEIASRTGGVAYYGRNSLDLGVASALDDSRVTYLLGYYAPQAGGSGADHRIDVRVRRPDVKLRYREGYSLEQPAATAPEKRTDQLTQASLAPMDSTAVPVDVTANRHQNAVTLLIRVNPSFLGLRRQDGRWQGSADVGTQYAADKAGPAFTLIYQPIDLDLSEEAYQAAQRDGLLFPKTLDIPPGADKVKVFVRSGVTGDVGSVTIALKSIVEK
jgi:VWFA-related protein